MEKNEKKSETLLIGIGGTGGNVVNLIKEQLKSKQMPRLISIDLDETDEEKEEKE